MRREEGLIPLHTGGVKSGVNLRGRSYVNSWGSNNTPCPEKTAPKHVKITLYRE